MAQGKIVVFEGIDQAGKATQTERLAALLEARGYATLRLAFPAYETPIGREIGAFLSGGVEIPLHVRHLLYAANRYEFKAQIERSVAEGTIVLIDRYSASGIVYGMAHGLPRGWLEALEAELPAPDFVFFLDLSPETARRRKRTARDRYERNLPLLATCRRLYREECERSAGWIRIDAESPPDVVAAEIEGAILPILAETPGGW